MDQRAGQILETITQAEQIKEKRIKKNENSLRDFRDNIKGTNICIIGIPEGEEKDKWAENLCEEIITESFPNLRKETDFQVQAAQRARNKINPKSPTPRCLIIKMSRIKDKERILQVRRERQQVTYKGNPIRLTPDFSAET